MPNYVSLPCLPSIWVEFRCLDSVYECSHVTLGDLRIREDVATLLIEDTRDAVAGIGRGLSVCTGEAELLTHSRLLCSLNAIGASGSMIIWHVFGTLTSRIAFRLIRFDVDLEPSVATSLSLLFWRIDKLGDGGLPDCRYASLSGSKDCRRLSADAT